MEKLEKCRKTTKFGVKPSRKAWRKWSGPGGENDLRRWWESVVYITSRKRTVRLGSLLGLYERFPIKNKSGRHP